MSNTIKNALDSLEKIFVVTDEMLNDWNGKGNLQFPVLLGMISIKMNWDEKKSREADPIVRYYVRNHPEWYVTRGAHGGIMRITEKQKKENAKTAKDAVKEQLKAVIENKVTDVKTDSSSSDVDSEE